MDAVFLGTPELKNMASDQRRNATGLLLLSPGGGRLPQEKRNKINNTLGRTQVITFVILVHRWKAMREGIPQKTNG
jgi:hypothetical protein